MATYNFYYTHDFHPNSELIVSGYYDAKSQSLLVRLTYGRFYLYPGVDWQVFSAFEKSVSAGAYYNSFIRDTASVRINDVLVRSDNLRDTKSETQQRPAHDIRKQEVGFLYEGQEKVFSVDSTSDEGALKTLQELGERLGMNFAPVWIKTYLKES